MTNVERDAGWNGARAAGILRGMLALRNTLRRTLAAPALLPLSLVAAGLAWLGRRLAQEALGGGEGFTDEVRTGALLLAGALVLSLSEPLELAREARGGLLLLRAAKGGGFALPQRWAGLLLAMLPTVVLAALLVLTMGLGATLWAVRSETLRLQAELVRQSREQERRAVDLAMQLGEVGETLTALQQSRERSREALGSLDQRWTELADRHEALHAQLADFGNEVHSLSQELAGLAGAHEDTARLVAATQESVQGLTIKAEELHGALNEERQELGGLQMAMAETRTATARSEEGLRRVEEKASALVDDARGDMHGRLDEMRRALESEYASLAVGLTPVDREAMVQSMLLPTVRVTCSQEVGSGTVVSSVPDAEGTFHSYVLSALHVVTAARDGAGVEVTVFDQEGNEVREIHAKLVSLRENVDLALLELDDDDAFPWCARIASPESMEQAEIFTPVYAVGCPLGYSPLPTMGELSSKAKFLGGERYWMINAPTIFGNSGGGIFLSRSRELIGVLSRVSAYNNFINIAVPHMGIVVPATDLYPWLQEEAFDFIVDPRASFQQCQERRQILRASRVEPPKDASSVRAVLR